jgi:hypothetical protein
VIFYPAAPFSWQARIKARSSELERIGYQNAGEWLTQEQQFTRPDNTTVIAPGLHTHCQELSERDIVNIIVSDWLILFEPGVPLERNTRIAEFGVALALGKQCIVIGPEDEDKKDVISNIFVHLHDVKPFRDWNSKWYKRMDEDERRVAGRIKPVVHYQHWLGFMADILNPERVECCAGCGCEYRVRDCGCPCGSYYKWKTRVTNFTVLEPPTEVRQSAALAHV